MTEILSRLAAAEARIVELEAACEEANDELGRLQSVLGEEDFALSSQVIEKVEAALAKVEK